MIQKFWSKWLWPLVGLINGMALAIDLEMSRAYAEAKPPSGPGLPSLTMMFAALAIGVLVLFGILQIVHGLRKGSDGIRAGALTIISAILFPPLLTWILNLTAIGTSLFEVCGYGSIDFYYSWILYVGFIAIFFVKGITKNLNLKSSH